MMKHAIRSEVKEERQMTMRRKWKPTNNINKEASRQQAKEHF